MDYERFYKDTRSTFVAIFVLTSFALSTFATSQDILSLGNLIFCLATMILNHAIHLQAFQITIFVTGVQVRLKIILTELNLNQTPEKLFEIKESFLLLHKANMLLNNFYKWPLLLNFMELYYNLLSNLYWLGMALLGLHSALMNGKLVTAYFFVKSLINLTIEIVSDALSFLLPSIAILLFSAHIDHQSQSVFRRIISASTSMGTQSSQSEEFLILLKRLKFSTESFGAFSISFATIGKVR